MVNEEREKPGKLEKKTNMLFEGLKYAIPVYGDIYAYKEIKKSNFPMHDMVGLMFLVLGLKYVFFYNLVVRGIIYACTGK